MTRDNLKLLRQWTQRPEEAFVRNLRLRALPSPNLALACRVAAKMPAPRTYSSHADMTRRVRTASW